MQVLDYQLRVNQAQRAAIDEAIRTVQFIRLFPREGLPAPPQTKQTTGLAAAP